MARFLTYIRITSGFLACAGLILFFISQFLGRLFAGERLELAVTMTAPFLLIGWAWISPWTSPIGYSGRLFSLLKLILVWHAALGLVAFLIGGIGFSVFLALILFDLVAQQGNRIVDLCLLLTRIGLFALLTDALVLLFMPSIKSEPSVIRFYRRGLGITSAALLICIVAWSLTVVPAAVKSAEALAGEEPYCIQVARGTGYKTAESLSDLNGLSMWALYNEMGSYFNYHAVLIVETSHSRRMFNWSHDQREFEFIPGRYANSGYTVRHIPLCEPRQRFVRTLPWF